MVVILKDIIIDDKTIRDVHIKDGEIQYVDPRKEEIERIKNIPETIEGN
jgi:predicted phosphatase